MKNKELIDIAKTLNVSDGDFSLFEFASKYLLNMKISGKTTSDGFFSMIEHYTYENNIKREKHFFGKTGKYTKIKDWCINIKKNRKKLEKLSLKDLHYVMKYGARLAKIEEIKNIP